MMRAGRRSRRGMAAATAAASVAAVPRLACQRRLLSASAVARGEVGVAVVGGSGYTGAELIRLLAAHPYAKVRLVTANAFAGQELGDVFASLEPFARANRLRPMCKLTEVDWAAEDVDVVFACLPHGVTQESVKELPAHLKVVDLSADFRLTDPAVYEEWYGTPHKALELQAEAVYGLTELFAPEVAKARLVANPGCYPTSVQLPLVPLVSAGLIEVEAAKGGHIVIDAKSGTSGAGRATGKGKEHLLYAEAAGSFMAYGIGSHRHMPEIEQGLVAANGGNPVDFSFTPHLVPMTRGILATMYVQARAGVSVDQLREHLADTYADAPFVHVLPAGKSPATAHVRGSNRTLISVTEDRVDGRAVVVCAIDNLVKGASGAAIQNMNVQFGWPESTGLDVIEPIFP